MIYFFYGENTYFVKKMANKIVSDFLKEENADLNFSSLDGENLDKNQFLNTINSIPFLSNKRLTLINNFLTKNSNTEFKKIIIDLAVKTFENSDILFVEDGQPDRRESAFKTLEKNAKTKKLDLLSEIECKKWISEKLAREKFSITLKALSKLYLCTGSDLWRIEQEISKLINYAKSQNSREVTEDSIELLVESQNNFKIFDLTDALGQTDLKKAILVLQSLLDDGEDALKVLNMIAYQLRNMLIISDVLKETTSQEAVAKNVKLHPFVVKKTISSLKSFNEDKLLCLYNGLCETDWKIKNGLIDPTLSLNLLLVDFCKK